MKKINERRDFIKDNQNDAGKTLANSISMAGVNAILKGMKNSDGSSTNEWKTLMEYFANNDDELKRLCGEDDAFNQFDWSSQCLAYIAGNSLCTVTSATMTGTGRNFTPEMEKDLDRDV